MDAFTRLIQESILIETDSTLNSKSEWGRSRRPRLMFEQMDWEVKKAGTEKEIKTLSEKNKVNEVLKRLQGSNRKCRRKERKVGLGDKSANNELMEGNHDNINDLSIMMNKIYRGIMETTSTGTGAYSAGVYSSGEELVNGVNSDIADKVGNEPKSESGAHSVDIQDENCGSEG